MSKRDSIVICNVISDFLLNIIDLNQIENSEQLFEL